MTELAALALRLGVLPSAIEREDPAVIDEMARLLMAADRESPGEDDGRAGSLARRWAGVD